MNKRKLAPPRSGRGDKVLAAVKVALAAVPALGGSAVEALNTIVVPPLCKRLEEWRESIAEAIRELTARVEGLSPDTLQNNPAFISTLAYATQVAIRTHQSEKLEALRNAILNVATGSEPDDDLHLMLLNLIDALTPGRIKILRTFSGGGAPLTSGVPVLQKDPALFDLMVRDLFERGLVGLRKGLMVRGPRDLYRINPRAPGTLELLGQITDLGKCFLSFVSSPTR